MPINTGSTKDKNSNAPTLPAAEPDAKGQYMDTAKEEEEEYATYTTEGEKFDPVSAHMQVRRGNITASGRYIRMAVAPESAGIEDNEKVRSIFVFRETEFDQGILRARLDKVWLASPDTDKALIEIPLYSLRAAEAKGKKELVIKYLVDRKTQKPCIPNDIISRHTSEIDAEMNGLAAQWNKVPEETKNNSHEFRMAKLRYTQLELEKSKLESSRQSKKLVEKNTGIATLKLSKSSLMPSPTVKTDTDATQGPAVGEYNIEHWKKSAHEEYNIWANMINVLIHTRDNVGYMPGIVISTVPNNCYLAWNLYENPNKKGEMISDALFDSRGTYNTYDKPMSGLAMSRGYHELWILRDGTNAKVVKVPLKGVDVYDRVILEDGTQSPGCIAILNGMKSENAEIFHEWTGALSRAVAAPDDVSAALPKEGAPAENNPDLDVRGVIVSDDCCMVFLPHGFFMTEAGGMRISSLNKFVPYNMVKSINYSKGRFEKTGSIQIKFMVYEKEKERGISIEFGAGGKSKITPEEYEMWRPVFMSAYEARNWDPIPNHKKTNQARGPVDAQGANVTDDGTGLPPAHGSPEWYNITKQDIDNNFERFEPFDFERLVTRLFEARGYTSITTPERGDFGVDVLVEYAGKKIAIQVKKYQGNVGGPDVNKTLGAMIVFGASQSMVITTGGFTQQCYDIQRRGHSIELWDGERTRREFAKTFLYGK